MSILQSLGEGGARDTLRDMPLRCSEARVARASSCAALLHAFNEIASQSFRNSVQIVAAGIPRTSESPCSITAIAHISKVEGSCWHKMTELYDFEFKNGKK